MAFEKEIEELTAQRKMYSAAISCINDEIARLQDHVDNHAYATIEKAETAICNKFESEANEACEGSGCMGCSEYVQQFTVDGKPYSGIVRFEYNRHDKRYYYIDGGPYWSFVDGHEYVTKW